MGKTRHFVDLTYNKPVYRGTDCVLIFAWTGKEKIREFSKLFYYSLSEFRPNHLLTNFTGRDLKAIKPRSLRFEITSQC